MKEIRFFGPDGAYGYLSNFYEAPVSYESRLYSTNEHFFQAMKMTNVWDHEKVRSASTPAKAKREGRLHDMRPDWDIIKPAIMYMGLRLKFSQYPKLAEGLVATGNARLLESNPRDSYWGTGRGNGTNQLGKLLMQVRVDLIEDEHWR